MTTNEPQPRSGGSGGNSWLAFIVGGLLIAVVVIGFMLWSGGERPQAPTIPDEVDVNVDVPEVEVPDAPTPSPAPAEG